MRMSGSASVIIRARNPESQKIETIKNISRRSRKNENNINTREKASILANTIQMPKNTCCSRVIRDWNTWKLSISKTGLYPRYTSCSEFFCDGSLIYATILYGFQRVYPISDIFARTMLSGSTIQKPGKSSLTCTILPLTGDPFSESGGNILDSPKVSHTDCPIRNDSDRLGNKGELPASWIL